MKKCKVFFCTKKYSSPFPVWSAHPTLNSSGNRTVAPQPLLFWSSPKLRKHIISYYFRLATRSYCVVELVGRGFVIKWATMSSSNIRVDFDGRCGEGSESMPPYTTCLDSNHGLAPATAHAPATVHTTINCQPTQGKAMP